jgi:serine/threonine protein kinase/tetratricopeptide (TPR) repeat protein
MELPGDQVAAFLVRECGPDTALRSEVESLLAATARRPAFLGAPTAFGAATASPSGDVAGTTIGRYRLVREIGQGGFGSVYVAEQLEPVKRQVAVKIIKLGMDTRAVIARFEAERQALAMMDHANIARVFDAGTTDAGRPYFVMELVEGEPITTYCDSHNLSIAERLGVFVQVCRAVQHAHLKGVIHRDIKPGNVLVSTQDGRPHVKVIDFGIAKATEQSRTAQTAFTEHRQFVGTPEYMSPEQAESSQNVDTRTDVYSLGVLLYELLTGATPFDSQSLRSAAYGEIQRIIREVEPPKPSTRVSTLGDAVAAVAASRRTEPGRLSPQLRGDLDWIVMRCLEKDRARRYATTDALGADLEAFLRGDPVSAVPPSTGYRVRKFVGRNKGLVAATSTIAVALVLGVIGTSTGMITAKQARSEAQASAERASKEADQAKAINEFMREVLTSVEPQRGGADVRLMDVMANATALATQRFEKLPLLEAQVQDLLAAVYSKISQFALARAAADRAMALYQTHAGPDDPRTLGAESRLVGALLNLTLTDEAERLIAGLLPRADRLLGADDLTTLNVRRGLASVHMLRGRVDEAERLFLELRDHPRLASEDRLQALILVSLCRIQQRRPLSQDPVERAAHWRRTLELARECVDRSVRASGPSAADAFHARAFLAQALCDLGSVREAADLARSLLAESEGRLDPCHISRRIAMTVLADALAGLGELREPADVYLQIIDCARTSQTGDPILLVSNIGNCLKYFERSGRAAEGEVLAREGLSLMATFGAGHSDVTIVFELYIAAFVSMRGQTDEAEALFAPLLAKEESLPGVQLRTRLHLFYGGHLMRLGRFEEAEQFLLRADNIRGQGVAGSRDRIADEVLCGFIALYQAWQRPDKVAEYERRREAECGIPPRP